MIKSVVEQINKSKELKVVFFGDSVTHGFFESHEGMHGTTDYDSVFHNVLKQQLDMYFPDCRIEFINSGVGGETAAKSIERIESDVLTHRPDLVVVCFGLNDIGGDIESYKRALCDIFEKIKGIGAEIVFMTPNMFNTEVTSDILKDIAKNTAEIQNSGKMDNFMDAARKVAREHDVILCDCYSKWKHLNKIGVNTNLLLANRINHPTRRMHQLFANSLFDTIFMEE